MKMTVFHAQLVIFSGELVKLVGPLEGFLVEGVIGLLQLALLMSQGLNLLLGIADLSLQ